MSRNGPLDAPLSRRRGISDGDYIAQLTKRNNDLLQRNNDLIQRNEDLTTSLEDIASSHEVILNDNGVELDNDDDNSSDDGTTSDGDNNYADKLRDSLSSIFSVSADAAHALSSLDGTIASSRRLIHNYTSVTTIAPFYEDCPGGHKGYCKNIFIDEEGKGSRCMKECRVVCIECTYTFGGGDHFYVCQKCRLSTEPDTSHTRMSKMRYKATVNYNHSGNPH